MGGEGLSIRAQNREGLWELQATASGQFQDIARPSGKAGNRGKVG
jgi:hypothetical protein